ncbi:MAG: periplasmic heavy metal sensor [Cyclobacteriaceae bacterium]
MKNWKLLLAALLVAGMSTINLQAQPHKHNRGEQSERHGPERMMERLDMTDDQKAEAEQLHLRMRKAILPIENEIGEKAARLKTLMSGGAANEDAIYDVIEEIGMLEISMKKERASTRLAVRELLTEDQQIKFDQMPLKHSRRGGGPGSRHGQ